MKKTNVPSTYQSGGKTISKNTQHDLWIITDNTTGKWHSVSYSDEQVVKVYKPD